MREGRFHDYANVFQEWLCTGVIEEVPADEIKNRCHYLPHRGVFKQGSTTTVRPVFDASCRGKGSPSLNDCLETGPSLLEQIVPIMIRFRRGKFGVISDIKRAFLQISVALEDRDLLRFLWWNDFTKKQFKIFRHKREVFGLNCSPFLLGAVLDLHLKKNSAQYQDTVRLLERSLYVDNCVTSFDNEQEVKGFIEESTKILATAHFELRGWECNSKKEGENLLDVSPVLGLLWERNDDVVYCGIKPVAEVEMVTRRKMLSLAHRIFDPIGFTCPFTLLPKILLQATWNLTWDEPVSEEIQRKFKRWERETPKLAEVKIPRCITIDESRATWSLHIFCDASQEAYAAGVYLRSEFENDVLVQLVQARASVAPLKVIMLPRLELLGCCIRARLAASVRDRLDLNIPEFYWTDSGTALFWIRGENTWGPFVNNRVKEIRQLTNKQVWRHVPGELNPADLPSRGCFIDTLIKSRWWEGPAWLHDKMEIWPKSEVLPNYNQIQDEEQKESRVLICNIQEEERNWYLQRFSKFPQIVGLFGWILRFKWNSLRKNERKAGDLSVLELEYAEIKLFRIVQGEPALKKENLKTLHIFVDEDGLVRLETKLTRREDSKTFRYPNLLPSDHPLVEILVREYHLQHSHAGVQTLLTLLREKFWIIKGRKTVRKVIKKCVRCRRFEATRSSVEPAPLPEDRVKDAPVFEVTGVDMAGPLYLRNGDRSWILLFTCAVYRAVHLELALSLSTECFSQGLRRFIARRGRPRVVYSDNGTNFTGAENLFELLDWDRITRETSVFRIQ